MVQTGWWYKMTFIQKLTIQDLVVSLRQLWIAIVNHPTIDMSQNRVRVEAAIAGSQTLGTVSTVSTVTSVTAVADVTNVGSRPATGMNQSAEVTAWAVSQRTRIG